MKTPQPIEIDEAQVERLIEQAQQGQLDAAAQKRIVPLLRTLVWLEHTLPVPWCINPLHHRAPQMGQDKARPAGNSSLYCQGAQRGIGPFEGLPSGEAAGRGAVRRCCARLN